MFNRIIASLVFVSTAMFAVDTTHTMTVEDLFAMQRLSSPVISPDGSRVAYVVDTYSMENNNHFKHIWLLELPDGTTRQITSGDANDYSPGWSEDGNSLYFLSDRSGSSALYTLSMEGGEAQEYIRLDADINDYFLSPASRTVYMLLDLYPECGTNWECHKNRTEEEASAPVKARIYDDLFIRHWNHWIGKTVSHLVAYDLETGKSVDLTPGRHPVPPVALGGEYDVTLSSDGKKVVWVTDESPDIERSTNHDLMFLNSETGERINLTSENRAWDTSPQFSPDGQYLAYLAMQKPGYEADQVDLMVRELVSGKTKNMTGHFDLSVGKFAFTPDGKSILFLSGRRGYVELFRMNLDSGKIRMLTEKRTISDFEMEPDGNFIVALVEHSSMPRELYRIDPQDASFKRLTFHNRERVERIRWGSLKEVEYPSKDGTSIHALMVTPPDFDRMKTYPMLLVVHGGPQGATEDDFHYRWNLQMFAAHGYVVFAPNFRGSTGYGAAFKEAISNDWGGKPYEDVISGIDYVVKTYPFIDGDKIVAAGASYGGYMINWIATRTDRFRALVSHAGLFDVFSKYGSTEELWFPEWEFGGDPYQNPELYEKYSPSTYVTNMKTPMLVIHGAKDFRVSMNQALQLFTALQRLGVESRLLFFPDEDHFVRKPQNAKLWWSEVFRWFDIHLQP